MLSSRPSYSSVLSSSPFSSFPSAAFPVSTSSTCVRKAFCWMCCSLSSERCKLEYVWRFEGLIPVDALLYVDLSGGRRGSSTEAANAFRRERRQLRHLAEARSALPVPIAKKKKLLQCMSNESNPMQCLGLENALRQKSLADKSLGVTSFGVASVTQTLYTNTLQG